MNLNYFFVVCFVLAASMQESFAQGSVNDHLADRYKIGSTLYEYYKKGSGGNLSTRLDDSRDLNEAWLKSRNEKWEAEQLRVDNFLRRMEKDALRKHEFSIQGELYYSQVPVQTFGNDGAVIFRYNDKDGLCYKGYLVLPNEYEYIGQVVNGFAKVKVDGKYGYITEFGEKITPVHYEEVGYFSEGLAWVRRDGKWGYIDETGAELVPLQYQEVTDFQGGMAAVKLGFKWGLINRAGEMVVAPQYNEIRHVDGKNGQVLVSVDGAYFTIDEEGKEILPQKYDDTKEVSQTLVAVNVGGRFGKWGINHIDGRMVTGLKYDHIGQLREGLAKVCINNLWGFIDSIGQEVIEPQYDNVGNFEDGTAIVERSGLFGGGKIGLIDRKGKTVAPIEFEVDGMGGLFKDYIDKLDFENGLLKVSKKGKFGFMTRSGEIQIPIVYDDAGNFSASGLAAVCASGKWGYIDVSGKQVIPMVYEGVSLSAFANGLSRVCKNGKWGIIDATHKIKLPLKYDDVDINGGIYRGVGNGNITAKAGKKELKFLITKSGKIKKK